MLALVRDERARRGLGGGRADALQLAPGQSELLLDELLPVEVRELPEDLAVLVRPSTN